MALSIGFHGTAEAGAMKLFADWAINCTVDRLISEEICRSVSRASGLESLAFKFRSRPSRSSTLKQVVCLYLMSR